MRWLGKTVLSYISELGKAVLFFWDILRRLPGGLNFQEVIHQIHAVGVRSLSTTVVTGAFVGAIMAIQIHLQLKDFGAAAYLGGLSTSVTIRNVGPVLIAFILSGKVGAYTSAELATMRVTDQIDAIRCLGMDPLRYLVVPRMFAVVVSSFLLLVVGLMVTVLGGVLMAAFQLDVNSLNYIRNIPSIVSWWSVGMGGVKSLVFGVLIGWMACYRGYNATGGSEGVGKAVKGTSVITLVTLIVVNYFLTWGGAQLHTFLGVDIL